MASVRHLVVVAGDDHAAVDALAGTLRDDGTVRTAYSVDALTESLDAAVDVVLVDGALSDRPVSAVLDDLDSRDIGCQVAVLDTDPDATRDALAGAADAVLPWDEAAVRGTVRRLAARARYRTRLDECYALAEERAKLDDTADGTDVERLDRRLDRLRHDLSAEFERIDDTSAFDAALGPDERRLATDDASSTRDDPTDGETGDEAADRSPTESDSNHEDE